MTRTNKLAGAFAISILGLALGSCTGEAVPAATTVETNTSEIIDATPKVGGLAVPSEVRENLGITFAKVERRQVLDTLRVPGEFELLPGARSEYRAQLAGHVQTAVSEFQTVDKGELLFTLDSPDWRRIQHEAVEAEGDIKMAEASLEVAKARLQEARGSEAIAEERVKTLATAHVRKAELEAEAAALKGSLTRLQAEIAAAETSLDESHEHYLSRLRTLASISSLTIEELQAGSQAGAPAWRAIGALEVRAKQSGTVEKVAINQGAWLETGELAITIINPAALRFHGEAPQSELARMTDGAQCRIVPPQGGGVELQSIMSGRMRIGLTAHSEDRTISLYVEPESLAAWARAGVSAFAEISREDSASDLAIPVASLVQNGLDTLFFRRNPKDPDRVLPVKADLGASDGRWVAVRSGVKEGDEVVLDGAYALKLAGGSAKAPAGYHYHADGTLHKNH